MPDAGELEAEVERLREENLQLLEALRLAQLGGADLQGHLSKYNPDAGQQGIFSQDWELRYFVLSGDLLKYYTSDREPGYGAPPRGVLELEGCFVDVEPPSGPKGPFVFQIRDPEGDLLLRLSADKLAAVKAWLRTLHAAGLPVNGYKRLSAAAKGAPAAGASAAAGQQQPGGAQGRRQGAPGAQGSGGSGSSSGSLAGSIAAGLGRVLGARWGATQPATVTSSDSGLSLYRKAGAHHHHQQQQHAQQQQPAAAAGAAAPGGGTLRQQPSMQSLPEDGPLSGSEESSDSGDDATSRPTPAGYERSGSSGVGSELQQAPPPQLAALRRGGSGALGASRRWAKIDHGDELPAAEHSSDEESDDGDGGGEDAGGEGVGDGQASPAKGGAAGPAAAMAATAAAAAAATAAPAGGGSAAAAATGREQQQQQLAAASSGQVVVKSKRAQMTGASPVHVAAKDSILTDIADNWASSQHEGLLNLGVVVLLATNIRMIINNLTTYGLRLRVDRSLLAGALASPSARDDAATFAAVPACALFALAAWGIELLGLRLLLQQEKTLRALQKKEVLPAELVRRARAATVWQERLLLLLNLVNAGGSLVWPCLFVLGNKASLIPASLLTVVAIVTSMKLATYAHANTALRCEARARATAAAGAGQPIPDSLAAPAAGGDGGGGAGAGGGRGGRALRRILGRSSSIMQKGGGGGVLSGAAGLRRSFLARRSFAARGAHAAPDAAAAAAVAAASDGARSSSPFSGAASAAMPAGGRPPVAAPPPPLSRSASLARRQAAVAAAAAAAGPESMTHALVTVGDVAYPYNLTPADLAYFLAAPTLTYQLNYPRLQRVRWRLLGRWVALLLLTAVAMSFMQVQFLLPCMQRSLEPLRAMNWARFAEALLRLAVPNTLVWLAMFYLVFHLWLNILGEVLRFGDRMFYKEWWNAATLGDYWRLWNIPVHKWMLRTVFFPLSRRGFSKFPAMLAVFFVSAVMHELAVGVPLRMLRGWAFWGMMAQVPLITVTELLRKRIKADNLGNMVFWASFCVLGQPMCLVMYYMDWLLAYAGEQGLRQAAAAGVGNSAAVVALLAVNGTAPECVAPQAAAT